MANIPETQNVALWSIKRKKKNQPATLKFRIDVNKYSLYQFLGTTGQKHSIR